MEGFFSLEHQGIISVGKEHWNLSTPALIEAAIQRGEGILTHTGSLCVSTGSRTGRSPQDKFVVDDPSVHDSIWWGTVNQPISPQTFDYLLQKVQQYLEGREVFIFDGFAGADPRYRLSIRVITELAWHNLFARQLFLRPDHHHLSHHHPEFTVISVPGFNADPGKDGTRSDAFIMLNLTKRIVLIGGTHYAGEMKKAVFTVMNYLLPERGVCPMHCAANVGAEGDVTLFFGLSGTGKTSLSADPDRKLLGDDEHGWSDHGVFNFEGGCYAKCIRLSPVYEPQIWKALRFGAVLENVMVDPITREPDYDDDSITENTRAAYPIDYIDGAVKEGVAGHPKVILFLSADAFGVLPPIARLTPEQAVYYFLSGYTSRLAGTEAGLGSEPQATFSTCFGAPFLPRPPKVYAELLREKIKKYQVRTYLINTGWTGGPYGIGHRFPIAETRKIVRSAISGELEALEWKRDPFFRFEVPTRIPGVPETLLNPQSTWDNPRAYEEQACKLAKAFVENFKKFASDFPGLELIGPRPDL